MNSISIGATLLVVLSIFGSNEAAPSAPLVKLASFHIVKKPIHVVSDKFLSFTVDPDTISHVADCSLTNATLNMAKSLAPAYFRLAGVNSNRFVFQSNPNINNTELISKSNIFSVSNTKWLELNNFLSKTGMNVVACVSGQTESTNKGWDLSNTLELISFSDKHNISLDWQLGYELQKLGSSQGKLMGRDVTRLRKILDVFPRYRKSLIIGPDMTSFKSQNDAIFVRNYLTEAGDSLDAFTWHPFSKSSEDNEILEMLANGMNSMDTYLWIKDGLMKSSSKGVVPKKSIWIAESESTETVSNLTDSMTWILRMGAAAKLGASVYLRKPHLLSFYEPTPEYWISVLYKSLVGRTVLDIKQSSGNGTNQVHLFTHCTKFIEKPDESIINPEISYDPGSITVYGVNMASESMRLSFKIGYKGDETAHIYVLTEDKSGDFPKTLLNRQSLSLSPENELPLISPRIRETPKYLLIPGRSIFFVVFPNTKCRSCNEFDSPDTSKSKVKIFEEEDQETNTFTSNVLEIMEDENDHDSVYVSYPKRVENSPQTVTNSRPLFDDTLNQSNPQNNIKYVTFSDETWLNPFPEKFKDIVNREKVGVIDEKNSKKTTMYRTLAQAILGKRTGQNTAKEVPKVEDPTTRFVFEDDSESNQFKRALNKSPARTRRALELESAPTNGSDSKNEPKEKTVDSKIEGLSLKPVLQLTSMNKSESEDDLDFFENVNEEEIPKTVSEVSDEDDDNSPIFAIYVFNSDNETLSLKTTKNSPFYDTYSKINAVLLNDDNLEQAMNSTEFEHTIPLLTYIQKSTFDYLMEVYEQRMKLEESLKPASVNKSESKDNSKQFFDDEEEETSKSFSDISDRNGDLRNVVLYLFNTDNETVSFKTTKNSPLPGTYSKINAALLSNDNLKQALNSAEFNQTIPNLTFIQKSTFDHLMKAFKQRTKREINQDLPLKKGIVSETLDNSTSSSGNSTQTPCNGESPSADELINNILDNASKLIQKFFTSDSFKEKFDSNDVINKTRSRINRLLAQAMLSKLTTSIPSKESAKPENLARKFILEDDTQSDQFKEALKNFNKFKRSIESLEDSSLAFDESNETIKPEQKITKREGNTEGSSILKSEVDMDASEMALYLLDQQDDESRSFETQKRSPSKIYAVPLNEDNLQMAMQSSEFRETIPIVTFVRKPILEDIVEAANERIKREAPKLENFTIPEVSNNLTVSSPQILSNSSNQPESKPILQLSTTQPPSKDDKLVQDPSKEITEEADKLIQQFSQENAKNQSSIAPLVNLQQPSLPELFKESEGSEVSRDLREVDDESESMENAVGTRRLKTIDKPNTRPVSPFPKKSKNVKSKSSKGSKAKSSDNLQQTRQNITSTSLPSAEPVLSTKRQTQEAISSNQPKSADLIKTPASSDDSEEDPNEDSATVTKLQSEIYKNLQSPSTQTEIKQSTIESVSSKLEKSSPPENNPTILQNKPALNPLSKTVDSETVGKPQKKPTLADLARRAHSKQATPILQPKKPKMTAEQLRMSYAQKRKELLQKHIARLNEIRSLLGLPALSEPRLHKRDANVFEEWWRESKNVLSDFWDKIRDWDPRSTQLAEEIKQVEDLVTGRNKRQNDEDITEQYPPSSLEIFKNNRFKRDSDIVVSPRIFQQTSQQENIEAYMARQEERQSQIRKFWDEKKAQAKAENPHIIHHRDLRYVEKAKALKEMKEKRINEQRQKLAQHIEEMKQKLARHEPKISHRNKRDTQTIQDKIHKLKENRQARSEELRQKLKNHFSELKQKLARHEPIISHRNKRDVQKIQDKIQELRKKKQEHRQELQKKMDAKHSVDQPATPAPSKLTPKQEIEHPAEKPVNPAPAPSKSKIRSEIEHPVEKLVTPAPAAFKSKPKSEIEHPVEKPATPAPASSKSKSKSETEVENPESPAPTKLKTKPVKIDEPRHQTDKTSKRSHKSLPMKEKSNRVHKRETDKNQLEEKLTSPTDLQKDLKFRLFVDPELNTPQSMLEDENFDDVDRLKRSISDNEIFDDDYEIGAKIKNKDHDDYKYSKFNVDNSVLVSSTSTSNPLSMKTGESKIKSFVSQDTSSQENQTCQITNYNVFKYFICVAQKLWHNYISI